MSIEKVCACLRAFGLENRMQQSSAKVAAKTMNVVQHAKTSADMCKLPGMLS